MNNFNENKIYNDKNYYILFIDICKYWRIRKIWILAKFNLFCFSILIFYYIKIQDIYKNIEDIFEKLILDIKINIKFNKNIDNFSNE